MFVSQAFATEIITEVEHVGQEIAQGAAKVEKVFPPFDFAHFPSHLFWLAISFGLFYLFISRVIVPRLGGAIETRRDRIASDIDQAARMKEEADAAVAAYEKELAEARLRASTIAQEASDKVKAQAEKDRKATEVKLNKKLREAEEKIIAIRDKAMSDVGLIAEETATEIVRKITGVGADSKAIASAVKNVRG